MAVPATDDFDMALYEMSLFTPAAALMNRLRYGSKFVLITVLFVIPIAWGSVQFYQSIDKNAAFSAKEKLGNDYLRPLSRLLFTLPRVRATQSAFLAGNGKTSEQAGWQATKTDVQTLLQTVGEQNKKNGATLEASGNYDALQKEWSAVKAAQTIAEANDAQARFLSALRALVKTVGDKSNLILDPDLDSYYLMDTTLIKLPEAGQLFVEAQAQVEQTGTTGKVSGGDKARLIGLASLMDANTQKMKAGLETAYKNNPAQNVEAKLSEPLNTGVSARQSLTASLTERANGAAVNGLPGLLADAVATSDTLADKAFTENDVIIERRVEAYREQQRWLVGLSLASLLLALYLLVGFYQSVVNAVKRLNTAATGLLKGGADVDEVRLDTQDELSQVASSFNTVLTRFKREWEQAREERIRAEEAESNYRTIFENANEGIYQTQPGGTFLRANPGLAHICGYESPDALMSAIRNVGTELYADPLRRAAYREAMEKVGEVQGFESQILKADGTTAWISENAHAVKNPDGSVRYYEGTITDISTEKERLSAMTTAREAAEAANRAKSDFLAKMSHELRTPLNAIIGYSEILQEEAEDIGQDNFVPDLQKINSAGKHLLGLINDILDLSKIEAGKMELYLEVFAVENMVTDVVNTVKPLVDKNQNAIVVETEGDLGTIRADLTKVRQNLFNLLSNASKFTDKGQIRLCVQIGRAHV